MMAASRLKYNTTNYGGREYIATNSDLNGEFVLPNLQNEVSIVVESILKKLVTLFVGYQYCGLSKAKASSNIL